MSKIPDCTMPLKRLLALFAGSSSWDIGFDFSGLSMVKPKIRPAGTNINRIDPEST